MSVPPRFTSSCTVGAGRHGVEAFLEICHGVHAVGAHAHDDVTGLEARLRGRAPRQDPRHLGPRSPGPGWVTGWCTAHPATRGRRGGTGRAPTPRPRPAGPGTNSPMVSLPRFICPSRMPSTRPWLSRSTPPHDVGPSGISASMALTRSIPPSSWTPVPTSWTIPTAAVAGCPNDEDDAVGTQTRHDVDIVRLRRLRRRRWPVQAALGADDGHTGVRVRSRRPDPACACRWT